jgi:hypothetical protein
MSSRASSQFSSNKKLVEGKWVEESNKDSKVHVDVFMRDSNTGELIGKGTFECNPDNENRDKYEESIPIKTITGQEIGSATVEITKPKAEAPKSIDSEFRNMRRALGGMMRKTNRMFRDFNRNFFNDENMGFGVLDDILRPSLMLEDEDSWFPEFRLQGSNQGQKSLEHKKEGEKKESGEKKEIGGQKEGEKKETEWKRESGRKDLVPEESKPKEVEINEEK